MRKRRLFIFIISIMLYTVQSVTGQDSTKLLFIDYLIKIGDLNPTEDKQKYFNNIFVVDLLKFVATDNKGKGIFKFGTFADHSKTYLLLKDHQSCQILGLQKLDEDILIELVFLKKHKTTPTKLLKYIEATIAEYQKNLKVIPWTE